MQNKAGKGFNVSKMLGAVGEAGEKAMPAFQKAKKSRLVRNVLLRASMLLVKEKLRLQAGFQQKRQHQERVQDL